MSRKMTQYSAEFKTKIVLEVLAGNKTLNEIASVYNIIPKNIMNWKKIFLDNASLAMEPSKAVKEYKDANVKLQEQLDEYAKVVGKLTVDNEWLTGKLKSLGLSNKKALVESKLTTTISIKRQCELIGLNRSSLYYTPAINTNEMGIKNHIQKIYEEMPLYGYLKVHQQLLEDGFVVSANTVQKYRKDMGLKAILAVRKPNASQPNIAHPIYSYKLKGIDIARANQVWSTDITYIKIKGGMVYMAAIIDWYSKAVLSWKIANTMDTALVMSVLDEALLLYGKPEILNTDQGSQYTSYIHTKTLKDNGITISMDSKGRATDNICIERFWRSAKCEKIYLNEYSKVTTLKDDVREYIDFYNHKRFHESLVYKKPMSVYYESIKANDKNYDKDCAINYANLDESVA
jgi:putative transposase